MKKELTKAQLFAIVNNSNEAIALLNENFQPIYSSPSAETITGWTVEERTTYNSTDKTHPEDLPKLKSAREEVLKNPGKSILSIFRTQHKDGHYVWLRSVMTNLLQDEAVKGIVVNFEDFTHKKKYEEELVMFSSIVNSSDDAILSKNLQGIITSWNQGAEKLFGYTSKEVIGKPISILVPPHLKNEEKEIIEKVGKGAGLDYYETERIKKDGKTIHVSLTISPIKDSHGNITGASKILRDITERKKIEREVHRVYKEKESALNRINDGVVSVDMDWRYTFLNDAALATHPIGKEETLGKVMWDIHPEMKGTIFWDKYHEAMLTKKVVEVESHYAPMNTWFSVKIYPSSDGLTIFYKDITERKKTEEDLLKSLKETVDYKYALDESSIVAITDQKGVITYVNDNFCKISKYSKQELIGQDHRIINSGYHSKDFIKGIWTTIAKGKVWKGEIKNKAKDGTFYWVDTTIVPFLDDHKKPFQYVAIRSDITERKKTEEDLLKSLKETLNYKEALDESSIVAITDQKGTIQYANDNFCKISKYNKQELIGQDHRIINSGYHSKDFIKGIWTTIANGKVWKGEMKNKAKDGTFYWVDTTIVPFLDDHKKPFQYVAIRSDITERKRGETEILELNEGLEKKIQERTEQLEIANKGLDSFSYSVAHDLRSPIRAIHGYATILEEDCREQLNSEAKRLIFEIEYNAKKMGSLIDDLLAFSRLGRKEINRVPVNMDNLMKDLLKEINFENKKSDVKLHKLHSIVADKAMMNQVMTNLLSNAIKYSSKKSNPVIEIKSEHKNEDFIFSIKDNGVGFDMEYADKLFGVFQRLHSDEEFEGTGVGLAIVQSIIQRHGGKVWAESKEGEGATFYFSISKNSTIN